MKPHYEAYNGDLYEIYLDPIGEIVRVIMYLDKQGTGHTIHVEDLPPVVLSRIEHKQLKIFRHRL